ncbi:MAG: hypothetical protein NTX49_04285 [Chlamydiae bacterium]|nr:hypothetical protein [Chlamydiota bacterium]
MYKKIFYGIALICATSPMLAATNLDQQMTLPEKQQTGVVNLTLKQKQALASWIDLNYMPMSTLQQAPPVAQDNALSLSVNAQNGQQLILSDYTRWQVHPQDVTTSSAWIAAVPLTVKAGTDPMYPYVLTNTTTGQSVRAKQISPGSAPTPAK